MNIIIKNRMVQVAETILANKLPLPTLEEVKKEMESHLNDSTMDEEYIQSNYIHFHSETLGGKIYPQEDGTFKYVPYYSYGWSNPCGILGADNFPIIK